MLCRIGEVEVWRLLEMNGPFREATTLFPTAGPDVARIMEALAPGQIEAGTGRVILPIQGFLLKTPDHNVLVDACVGNHKTIPSFETWNMREDGRFLAALAAAGIGPDDVDYVFCTHLHVDHVGWNTRLENGRWVPTFRNARYLFPQADVGVFGANPSPSYRESVLPVIEAGQAETVGPDHGIGDHITLLPTPGHTPGHVSVRIRSGGAEAVITGDALHTTPQIRFPDWHFCYDSDADEAVASRLRLLGTAAETGARVLGSHFLLPSIGRIRAEGDGFRWDAD